MIHMTELEKDIDEDNYEVGIWIRFTRPLDGMDGQKLLRSHPDGCHSRMLKKYHNSRNYAYMVKSKWKYRVSHDQLEILKSNKIKFVRVDPYD